MSARPTSLSKWLRAGFARKDGKSHGGTSGAVVGPAPAHGSRAKRQHGTVTLWDLLTLFSGSTTFAGVLLAAEIAKLEGSSFVLVLVEGVVVSVICIWVIRGIGDNLFRRLVSRQVLQEEPTTWQTNLKVFTIYGLTVAWIIVSFILCYGSTKLFIYLCL